jgi:peptidylprolyl isomerase
MPYNIDQVVAGMVAAEKGEELPFDREELEALIFTFKEEMQAKQIKNNLIETQNYLQSIAADPKIVELVPQKLYSLVLKKGEGREIVEDDIVLSKYTTYILKDGIEKTDFVNEAHLVPISYADTIPGFAEGTRGMRIGERRKLFIHPDLAFGTHGGKLKPNQLFIIELEAVALQN